MCYRRNIKRGVFASLHKSQCNYLYLKNGWRHYHCSIKYTNSAGFACLLIRRLSKMMDVFMFVFCCGGGFARFLAFPTPPNPSLSNTILLHDIIEQGNYISLTSDDSKLSGHAITIISFQSNWNISRLMNKSQFGVIKFRAHAMHPFRLLSGLPVLTFHSLVSDWCVESSAILFFEVERLTRSLVSVA